MGLVSRIIKIFVLINERFIIGTFVLSIIEWVIRLTLIGVGVVVLRWDAIGKTGVV